MRKHFLNTQPLESLSMRAVSRCWAADNFICFSSLYMQKFFMTGYPSFYREKWFLKYTHVSCIWYNLIFILYVTFDSKLFSPLTLSTELNLKGARKEHYQLRRGISYCVLSHNMNSLQFYCTWAISQMSWNQDILSFGVMLIILRDLQILWWTVELHHTALMLCVPLGTSIIKKTN